MQASTSPRIPNRVNHSSKALRCASRNATNGSAAYWVWRLFRQRSWATRSKSYDRVVIGKNGPYVLACFWAEGEDKTWWYMPHDEYVVLVEGEMTIEYREPRDEIAPGPHQTVTGTDMGSMVLRDGSLASLPAKIAYRMRAPKKSLALLQTKHSEWLTYAWEDICLTEA